MSSNTLHIQYYVHYSICRMSIWLNSLAGNMHPDLINESCNYATQMSSFEAYLIAQLVFIWL